MDYRIIASYIGILGFFGFLIFSYINYSQNNTPKIINERIVTPQVPQLSKDEVVNIVKNTIQDNPELIIKSTNDYQMKKIQESMDDAKKKVKENQTVIENNVDDPRVGSASAKIKVVEFFDYNCGYCKRMAAIKNMIIEENPDIQYVFKETPILGESSVLQAKGALAVYQIDPNKYLAFHTALLKSSAIKSEDDLVNIAGKVGVDIVKFKEVFSNPKLNDIIQANHNLAQNLGIRGTPGYVIAGELMPGILSYEDFSAQIKSAREKVGAEAPAVKIEQKVSPGSPLSTSVENSETPTNSVPNVEVKKEESPLKDHDTEVKDTADK